MNGSDNFIWTAVGAAEQHGRTGCLGEGKTMSAEIEKYPRFKVATLGKPPAPHKRHRRTNTEVAASKAAKEKRKATRST
jgi:hypothetical protein